MIVIKDGTEFFPAYKVRTHLGLKSTVSNLQNTTYRLKNSINPIKAARTGNSMVLRNPLNLGQMINNRTDDQTANVSYIEIDVPKNEINLEMVHESNYAVL